MGSKILVLIPFTMYVASKAQFVTTFLNIFLFFIFWMDKYKKWLVLLVQNFWRGSLIYASSNILKNLFYLITPMYISVKTSQDNVVLTVWNIWGLIEEVKSQPMSKLKGYWCLRNFPWLDVSPAINLTVSYFFCGCFSLSYPSTIYVASKGKTVTTFFKKINFFFVSEIIFIFNPKISNLYYIINYFLYLFFIFIFYKLLLHTMYFLRH